MNPEDVAQLVRARLTDCEIRVSGEGSHFEIVAIGEVFAGLRPVKKQQLVYAALGEHIASGAIHAVNIRTYTVAEWAQAGGAA